MLAEKWTLRDHANIERYILLHPCVLKQLDDEQSSPLRKEGGYSQPDIIFILKLVMRVVINLLGAL